MALETSGQSRDALLGFTEATARFREDPRPEVRTIVASCLFRMGVILAYTGDVEAALATFDDLLLFHQPRPLEIVELARKHRALLSARGEFRIVSAEVDYAMKRVGEATRLGEAGHLSDSIEISNEIITKFGLADYPDLRLLVAQALYNKGIALRDQARSGPGPLGCADPPRGRRPASRSCGYCRASSAGSRSTGNGQGITVRSPAEAVTVWTNRLRRSSETMMCGFGASSNRQYTAMPVSA